MLSGLELGDGIILYRGDCLDVMPGMEAGSVDLIAADLPYGTTANKWDAVIPLEPLWAEYRRLLKPRGAVVLTASQPFTSVLVLSNREWFKYTLVWDKTLVSHPFNAPYQPLRTHEDVCVFSPAASTYSTRGNMTYNPAMSGCEPDRRERKDGVSESFHSRIYTRGPVTYTERYPTSVIRVGNTERAGLHPTQKPVALFEYLIRTYSNPGDTVLDNAFGSCTTGVACLNTGRNFVGVERDPGYFEVGRKRIEEARAKTALFSGAAPPDPG